MIATSSSLKSSPPRRTIVRTATTALSEMIGHDQARAIAQQVERATVGCAGHAVIEVVDDLVRQMAQSQWVAAAIDDDSRRGAGEGVGIAADQALGQGIEYRVAVIGGDPDQLLSRRDDNGRPVRHGHRDGSAQPFVELGSGGRTVKL